MKTSTTLSLVAGAAAIAAGLGLAVYARKNPDKVEVAKNWFARSFTTTKLWLGRHGMTFLRWRPKLANAA